MALVGDSHIEPRGAEGDRDQNFVNGNWHATFLLRSYLYTAVAELFFLEPRRTGERVVAGFRHRAIHNVSTRAVRSSTYPRDGLRLED